MLWVDKVVDEIIAAHEKSGRKIIIRDEKTLSGRVHIGSVRGVAFHGIVSEVLRERGVAHEFLYEFNDMDPMDDIPSYLDRGTFEGQLGCSLRTIPSPEPEAGAENFAEYFGNEFREVIEGAGFSPKFYRAHELYLTGKMDNIIRTALDHAADISRIYREVSGSERAESWLPINIICPSCRKMTTTEATDWDGETVAVHCRPDKVDYTRGCDFSGRVAPFGGAAKLPWKVEWPAKWKVVGVTVEGAGKDHSTRGGSRDVANRISREVFDYEPPFDIPYEFILVGGRKMSSSKGRGSSAKEIFDLLPPQIFRFMLLSKDMNQAINFDPEGDTIPVLYDLYDKYAESFWSGVDDDYARLFTVAHPGFAAPEAHFLPRFSQVAYLSQMSHLDYFAEMAALKGAPLTETDQEEASQRDSYAKHWLGLYAPEKFVFKLQDTLPEVARDLASIQRVALEHLANKLEAAGDTLPSGEVVQTLLHEVKTEQDIPPVALFSAIYFAFLGKDSGPKAGWFLSVLPRDLVLKRLREAANAI